MRLASAVRLRSASYVVLGVLVGAQDTRAQTAAAQQASGTSLPPVTITAPEGKRRADLAPAQLRATRGSAQRRSQTAHRPETSPAPKPFAVSQDARTGTTGYYSDSTSVGTKTNTPLLNIPQSVSVLTKDFIQDQSTHGITELTRYVPGVAVHQGEGNRDELVIRGVDSSANFFVNGFRDDVQYYRDIYNTQSLEVLKGPAALVFGRGAGGGVVNRTLKEADGTRVYDASVQTGSYGDRRVTLDAGQAINENVAVRLNTFYEGSDTFRDYGNLERFGFNPTVTLKPDDDTKIKLSYEFYHDREVADRGNPSFGTGTLFNPTAPFAPNGNLSAFYGSPQYNNTRADVQTGMAVIEHDFGNGLTVKNSSLYADFNRSYQNVYPGSSVAANGSFSYNAYNHVTNRENAFNQTDFIYKTMTGPVRHTIAFGTEFDRQTGLDLRNTGIFASTGTNAAPGNALAPTYFGPVSFIHQLPGAFSPGVTAADSDSKYRLNIESAYAQDQIDITRWLQLIAGARFDRFELSATDENTAIFRTRTDDLVSPRAAVIVKPVDNLSVYGAYSISYLPSAGDQFSALNTGSALIPPQKFENTEVGVKWNIFPRLQYTAAIYQLNRTNVPLAIGGGLFAISGLNVIKGFETALTGYVTKDWQATLGYAYTDARIGSNTNSSTAANPAPPTILAGNRVQLVPFNQVSLWNKYQIDSMWGAGLGVIYFSDSFASSDDFVKLPGFVRVDAALYLKINQTWSGQLNIENVFNQGYWASADGDNNISPGQGRTFRLVARAKL
ncbi:MAG: TonB-dependent siderophore receptor [Bradyrhizobium sp.]|nr:MAG: TonB-dependent siderophore receptor [Bradyrhizobium sp.]